MAICEVGPVRQIVAICAEAQRAGGGEDEQRGEGRHGDGADDAGEQRQDQEHPEPGEDRRPAGAGAGGPVEGGLADRTADGLALEEPGAEVADALGDEVDVGVGAGPVVVGGGLGDAGALHEHDRGDRQRAGEQRPRERRQLGPRRQGDAAGDVALVLDLGDIGARDEHDDRRDGQGDDGAEGGDAGAAEQEDDGERRDADEDRRRSISLGWIRTSQAFCTATDPSASAPVRSGICPAMMFTATPLRKPTITEWLTNRVNRPRRSSPAAIIAAPAMRVRRNSAAGRSSGLEVLQRGSGGERGGARGGDHHQLRAGAEPAGDRPGEAGVEPVDRVDAGQHAGRHPVGDAADGAPASRPSRRSSACAAAAPPT